MSCIFRTSSSTHYIPDDLKSHNKFYEDISIAKFLSSEVF